tara:strand:+ start:469 stop:1269 length:801 start_codon:yes stop_codon:yes gene_type:complete
MSNDIEKKILTAPVPGMSFAASERKAFNWENPPVYTKIDEVLKFHLSKLNEDEAIESTIKLAQLGFPLMALTNAILTDAVSDGIHTIDSSEAARPAVFKHLMTTVEAAGIDFVTGYEEDNNLKNQADADHLEALIQKQLNDLPDDELDMDEYVDEDNLFSDALDYLAEGNFDFDQMKDLNSGFSDTQNLFENLDNYNEKNPIVPNPDNEDNPNMDQPSLPKIEEFEEETAPPEEGGPFNPFPLGSDENPLMAESKPTKGLMSRETV